MIGLGKISINPEAFKGVTQEEFIAMFKGKSDKCLNELWALLQDYLNGDLVVPLSEDNTVEKKPICLPCIKKAKKKKTNSPEN